MMRVYGFYSEDTPSFGVKSSAHYNRIPLRTTADYDALALAPTKEAELRPSSATHRVANGENLTRIVRDFLETQGKPPSNKDVYEGVRRVAEANGLKNANIIHPGQDLNLSVLQDRVSAVAVPLPQPMAAAIISTPLAAPTATLSDPLRLSALTQRDVPIKIIVPEELPAATLDTAARTEGTAPEELSGVGGEINVNVNALQKLLNGTSDALTLVRGILSKHDLAVPPSTPPTTNNPWDAVLNGRARLSSGFGMRKDPFTGRLGFHDGIDLAAPRGTEITAIRDGEVTYSGWKGGYGNTVIVRHDDGMESVYGHTSKIHVSTGDRVQAGALIANVGSTGRSTGPHLHLELRQHGKAVNPLLHLDEGALHLARNEMGS